MRPYPPSEHLHKLLKYDPETGLLFWRLRPNLKGSWNARFAGTQAGCLHANGYIYVCIDGVSYSAHRVIVTMQSGPIGDEVIVDHKNGCKSLNSWENLSLASHIENMKNQKRRQSNKSGFNGVSWSSRHGKWRACGRDGGRQVHLGLFHDPAEAGKIAKDFRSGKNYSERHGL